MLQFAEQLIDSLGMEKRVELENGCKVVYGTLEVKHGRKIEVRATSNLKGITARVTKPNGTIKWYTQITGPMLNKYIQQIVDFANY